MADAGQSQRALAPKLIAHFRGISQYRSIVGQPMEWAQDTLNVIIGNSGYLEKLRAPLAKSAKLGLYIDTMYDFQQAIGTRQLVINFLNPNPSLGFLTEPVLGGLYVFTAIENLAADAPRFSYIDSNNLLFMANGRRMLKWTGTVLQKWGIDAPPIPTLDNIGMKLPGVSATRAANVISFVITTTGITFNNFQAGDLFQATGWDATFNGTFAVISYNVGTNTLTCANIGANGASAAIGNISYFAEGAIFTSPVSVGRSNGVVTMLFGPAFSAGEEITITGFTLSDAGIDTSSLNGTFVIATVVTFGTYTWPQAGPDIPFGPCTAHKPTVAGGVTDILVNRAYAYAYGNSVTGHVGNATLYPFLFPATFAGGNPTLFSNRRNFLTPALPTDPQDDTIVWYGLLDGGTTFYFLAAFALGQANPSGTFGTNPDTFGDGVTDNLVDVTRRAQFINFPPPVGNLLSKWQGRIYLVPQNNPQSIVYSGYEKILQGRPEESFPPGNQIQLQIGAQPIKGHGAIMNGVVIWDSNNKMFMFKGTVEDIVTNQPVNYSEQLEEMPWQVGTLSHQCIQPTPYGLIWVGNDFAVHKWNGIFYGDIIGPTDISINVSPLMKRITPGTGPSIQSAYFNFLERDWYVILIAVDGSATNNRILFFDVSKDAADNLGVFVSDIQADSIAVRVDANEVRHLLISIQGTIYEIKAASTATAGIHKQITATNAQLDAFWLSGYDGNDDAVMMKMYRWGRLIADQDGFNVLVTLVNDTDSTLDSPTNLISVPNLTRRQNKFSMNWKAKRMSVQINFPPADVDASVLQLITTHIPLSER